MPVTAETTHNWQPVFDPTHPGRSLDKLNDLIPIRASWLRGIDFGITPSRQRGGGGWEVATLREYEPGDALRDVDWRATARNPLGQLEVKETFRDIEPAVWLLTDVVQPPFRANAGLFSKQNLGLSALLSILQLADYKRMPSGVVVSDGRELWESGQPSNGSNHLRATARKLAGLALAEPSTGPEKLHLSQALHQVGKKAVKNLVVVVSDFRDTLAPDQADNGWQAGVRRLHENDNELLAVEVTTPWDFRLPEAIDQVGGFWVGGRKQHRQQLRETYASLAETQQNNIDRALRQAEAYHVKLSTGDPCWFDTLRHNLQAFAQRR